MKNAALWAFAILVRLPLMLPFMGLRKLGEAAEAVEDWLGAVLPGPRRPLPPSDN